MIGSGSLAIPELEEVNGVVTLSRLQYAALLATARLAEKRKTVEVLPHGAEVEIGPEGAPIDAMVYQVCIKGAEQVVQYEVIWWASGERKSQWIDASEVRPSKGERAFIGFKP